MILDEIVASTKKLLEERKSKVPLPMVEREAAKQNPPQNFVSALKGQSIKLIAEVKRASPSKGLLASNLDAASLVQTYEKAGATAISVLTENKYFKGSLSDLKLFRGKVKLPILCKDFIFDPYQIYEARAYGADAILLIAAVLSRSEIKKLLETAHSLGMEALVEVHSQGELEQALKLNPEVIGINNRNLADFNVDLETTANLRPFIPEDKVVVSESGIRTREDVKKVERAGVNAILVGEVLVKSAAPAAKIRELLG